MRSEPEVREMLQAYQRFNEGIDRQILTTRAGDDDEDGNGLIAAFNSNSHILCALRWVLGEDTIKIKKEKPHA